MDYQQSFNNGVRPPSIRIRILVVDDQYMSLNIATTALRSLNYEVLTAKHPFEALSTLRLMRGGIDLVISDYHMPDMNGVQLQKQILEEFKIPVIMMSVDSREFVVVESLRGGSKVFLVKPINVEQVENVWQYVVANNKGKSPWVGNYQDPRPVSSLISSVSAGNMQEDEEGTGNNKNHKVIWTNALHTLFLQAINQIGLDKAVPKKILDRMNVPGLTRQHVGSHLQKYRKFLKKVAERGLVKSNDPEKAVNEVFEMTMASNAEYHDMIMSMPPSQFGRSQAQPNYLPARGTTSSSSSLLQCGASATINQHHHQFPTRLGLNSNHIGGGNNEHLIPSRLGLSTSYKPADDQYVLFHNNNDKWIQPNTTSTHAAYGGHPPSFNILNPPTLLTNHIQVTPPCLHDELKTTPPPPANMSDNPTLGDDVFDSLSNLLLLPQGNGDIDMALDFAPHLLDEEPITTNEPEDQTWDDDFIGSLLVDDGPYMEANERSC